MNKLKIEWKRLIDIIILIKVYLNDYLNEKKESVFKDIKDRQFFEKHSKSLIQKISI